MQTKEETKTETKKETAEIETRKRESMERHEWEGERAGERGEDSNPLLKENSDGSCRPVVVGPLLFIGSAGRKGERDLGTVCTRQT